MCVCVCDPGNDPCTKCGLRYVKLSGFSRRDNTNEVQTNLLRLGLVLAPDSEHEQFLAPTLVLTSCVRQWKLPMFSTGHWDVSYGSYCSMPISSEGAELSLSQALSLLSYGQTFSRHE